jgi:YidC/Oxa1 family membrane protein insertase
MFVSSWMSLSSAPATDPMQRNMLLVMPLMFAWICWGAPLGLVVYWTVNNLVQLAQQYLLNLTMPSPDLKPAPASSRRPGRKKT